MTDTLRDRLAMEIYRTTHADLPLAQLLADTAIRVFVAELRSEAADLRRERLSSASGPSRQERIIGADTLESCADKIEKEGTDG